MKHLYITSKIDPFIFSKYTMDSTGIGLYVYESNLQDAFNMLFNSLVLKEYVLKSAIQNKNMLAFLTSHLGCNIAIYDKDPDFFVDLNEVTFKQEDSILLIEYKGKFKAKQTRLPAGASIKCLLIHVDFVP